MLDKKIIGQNIANYRKRRNMTQKELAAMLNITAQSISKWEAGISIPTVEMLHAAAQVLDASMDSLLSSKVLENRDICYLDTGLDTTKLYTIKAQLDQMITQKEEVIYAHYIDPVIFQFDMEKLEEPVFGMITNVPGSKARLARERGCDREICADLTARSINSMLRFGLMPKILQAHIVCGAKEGEQLLAMGESFKNICEKNDVIFGGMEVACQPVHFRADEYELSVGLIGAASRKHLLTGEKVQAGDVLIGLMSDGIDASSYPFVRIMLDRRPELVYEKIDKEHFFIQEILKPNQAFTFAVRDLQEAGLLHGACRCDNSVLNDSLYRNTIPAGLRVCIDFSALPVKPLYRYLQKLDMVGKKFFPYRFHMGIGMMVIVAKEHTEKAMNIISRYHECHVVGHVEKIQDLPDTKGWLEGEKVWLERDIQW